MQTQRIRKEWNDAHFPSPSSYSSDIFVMLLSALLSFEMKQLSVWNIAFWKLTPCNISSLFIYFTWGDWHPSSGFHFIVSLLLLVPFLDAVGRGRAVFWCKTSTWKNRHISSIYYRKEPLHSLKRFFNCMVSFARETPFYITVKILQLSTEISSFISNISFQNAANSTGKLCLSHWDKIFCLGSKHMLRASFFFLQPRWICSLLNSMEMLKIGFGSTNDLWWINSQSDRILSDFFRKKKPKPQGLLFQYNSISWITL